MNDDYLWDKTGEPDPQIQQLEEILGTLRYQPTPLELPNDLVVPRRRSYVPLLAIAASVLFAIAAGAVWLRVRSLNEIPPQQAKIEAAIPVIEEPSGRAETPPSSVKKSAVHRRSRSASSALQEALIAKEQVMLALRVTTEKLSLVHKKTQIKNQHKVG